MKLTEEQRLKRAIASLDKAVQNYYNEVDPENKDHYASIHIRDYEDGHASRATLFVDGKYVDICSNKHR